MAQLTADDVVLKQFTTTKFREGYDQVEVDDFLDEVALAMRGLSGENDELRNKLAAAESRIAELEAGGAAPAAAAVPSPAPEAAPEPVAPVPAPAQGALPGFGAPAAPAPVEAPEEQSSTGLLALARKLHDQYVRDGQEEGDQILAEAKAKAAGIVREAEEASARTKSSLEQERADLEREIEGLRIFERDYRTRLRGYLSQLLADIDGAADKSKADPPGGGHLG
ncbi:MAG: DivIVA domain-containing protein [Bifidobacteriaceae bacterium]|jgi:DivIVA domain-containing protein|nr:DivIVA domain-containing protein [Bifidobacteriaceae bacterium]